MVCLWLVELEWLVCIILMLLIDAFSACFHTRPLADVCEGLCVDEPWPHPPVWSVWAAEASCTQTSPSSSRRQDPSPSASLSAPWSTCSQTGRMLRHTERIRFQIFTLCQDSSFLAGLLGWNIKKPTFWTHEDLLSINSSSTSLSCIHSSHIWDFCIDDYLPSADINQSPCTGAIC